MGHKEIRRRSKNEIKTITYMRKTKLLATIHRQQEQTSVTRPNLKMEGPDNETLLRGKSDKYLPLEILAPAGAEGLQPPAKGL